MAGKVTIKVPALSRDEVRAMDRAAKSCSPPASRSAWARNVLVKACAAPVPQTPQAAPAPLLPGNGSMVNEPVWSKTLIPPKRAGSPHVKCAHCGLPGSTHLPDCPSYEATSP